MPLALESISYKTGTFELKDLSLTIQDGEKVALMGVTGSGKSTLLSLFTDLEKPSAGRLLLDDEEQDVRNSVGLLFQYPERQLFASTVEEEVMFILRKKKLPKAEKQERLSWALKTMGFEEAVKDKSPFSLSGGEKRRLAIASVLIAKPRFLFLDEPFAGLDPLARESFEALLEDLNKEGMAIITITHNSDAAAKYERLVIMDKGKIVYDGRSEEVLAFPAKAKSFSLEPCTIGLLADLLGVEPTTKDATLVDEVVKKWGCR